MSAAARTYAIRVDGHLDDHWSTWLDGAVLRRCEDGTTSLTIADADQAQLHGLLGRLRDIGAQLVELRTTSVADQIRGPDRDGDRPTVAEAAPVPPART